MEIKKGYRRSLGPFVREHVYWRAPTSLPSAGRVPFLKKTRLLLLFYDRPHVLSVFYRFFFFFHRMKSGFSLRYTLCPCACSVNNEFLGITRHELNTIEPLFIQTILLLFKKKTVTAATCDGSCFRCPTYGQMVERHHVLPPLPRAMTAIVNIGGDGARTEPPIGSNRFR